MQTIYENTIVYSQEMAGILMSRGFKLVDTAKHKKNKNLNIFYFKNSDELQSNIEDIKHNLTNKKKG